MSDTKVETPFVDLYSELTNIQPTQADFGERVKSILGDILHSLDQKVEFVAAPAPEAAEPPALVTSGASGQVVDIAAIVKDAVDQAVAATKAAMAQGSAAAPAPVVAAVETPAADASPQDIQDATDATQAQGGDDLGGFTGPTQVETASSTESPGTSTGTTGSVPSGFGSGFAPTIR